MVAPQRGKRKKGIGRLEWKRIRIPYYVLRLLVVLGIMGLIGVGGSFIWAKHRGQESIVGRILSVLTKKVDERIKLLTSTDVEEEILAQRFATLTFYSGNVEVQRASELRWSDASERMSLETGDRVRTFGNSRADITFDDGNVLHIKPDSLIVIGDLTENVRTKIRKSSVKLLVSSIEADIKKSVVKGSQFKLEMPSAVAEVERARFAIDVGEDQGSRVKVFAGRVGIDTGTQRVELVDQKAISVSALRQLGQAENLLPAPRVLEPRNLQKFYTRSDSLPIECRWERVKGASSYRLEIATDLYFDKVVFTKTNLQESSLRIPELGGNVFFLRTAGLDARQRLGEYSEPVPFRIIVDRMPPHLEVTKFVVLRSAAGREVLVNGETEPFARVEIGGRPVNVDETGSFSTVIKRFSPGQEELEIVARDRAGNVRSIRKAVGA